MGSQRRNSHGTAINQWAASSGFTICRPPSPTFKCRSGSSTIDLILARNIPLTNPHVGEFSEISDHAPSSATASLSTPACTTTIPLSLISQPRARQSATTHYRTTLPTILADLRRASTATEFDTATHNAAHATLAPWSALHRPKSGRFRPGWTPALDKMAKSRSVLLRRRDQASVREARTLDRHIKRQVRRNRRRLLHQVADAMESDTNGRDVSSVMRLIRIASPTAHSSSTVPLADFHSMMQSIQPTIVEHVPTQCSDTPADFKSRIVGVITQAKRKRAPGPDNLRSEMLQTDAPLFASILASIWSTVGRLAHMPSILRSGWYLPLYKGCGDPADASSYRPISLTTIFRRLISAALASVVDEHYTPHAHQWGFRRGLNVENELAFANNKLRDSFPLAAVLDLRKAFDLVPRHILARLLGRRVPVSLARMLQALLSPMSMRTRDWKKWATILTTIGVPQGDPTSPLLFNLFMDEFLHATNARPRALTSCYADDVLLVASDECSMQTALADCER